MARTFAQIVARHTEPLTEKTREPPPKILARDRPTRPHPYVAPPLASIPNGPSHATKVRLLARGMAEKNGKGPFTPMPISGEVAASRTQGPDAHRIVPEAFDAPSDAAPEVVETPPVKSGGWLVTALNILATIFIAVIVIGVFKFYVK